MTDLRPPFRADHVGSLLRPAPIAQARKAGVTGDELKQIEDREIPALIKMQEDVGLKVVTDGEARRAFWHYDFMDGLTGLDIVETGGDALGFISAKVRRPLHLRGVYFSVLEPGEVAVGDPVEVVRRGP